MNLGVNEDEDIHHHLLQHINTYISHISKLPDGIIDELKTNIEINLIT